MADEVLQQGVRGITDLMVMPGLINLDFADVRSVMSEMGKAMMGTGEADGDNRAIEAAEKAIANPLLDGVIDEGRQGRDHLDHRRRGHAPDGGRRGRQPHPASWSIPTPTSSGVRRSTTTSTARSASRSSPPASRPTPGHASAAAGQGVHLPGQPRAEPAKSVEPQSEPHAGSAGRGPKWLDLDDPMAAAERAAGGDAGR